MPDGIAPRAVRHKTVAAPRKNAYFGGNAEGLPPDVRDHHQNV
jgi:hypothetical protein